MSSTSSFSISPPGPMAPESWPPWPASSTMVRSGVKASRPLRGSTGRATSSTSRGGSASVEAFSSPAAPSKVTRRIESAPARSSRASSTNPSAIDSTWGEAASPSRRIRSSLPAGPSMRWPIGADVSTTMRVNEG
jgi:hypothetical protein